jgi:hypothetical protein
MTELRVLLLITIAGAGVSALQAKDTGCTVADFSGTFGITVTGSILPGLPISGDFGRLGKVVADGAGNTVATTLANYNGNNVEEDFSGVYQVSDNCYLTWQATLPTGNLAVRFEGIIASGGTEVVLFIADPPGAILLGNLKKQKDGGCTSADLKGTYALSLSGPVEPGSPISGQFGRIGQVVFDGAGGASATTIASYGGAVLRENFGGAYTVNGDCHATWSTVLPPPIGIPITVEGVISADSTQVKLMITNPPGAVILGSLTKQ